MSLLTLTFCNTVNKYVQQQSVPEVYENLLAPITKQYSNLNGKENITEMLFNF